MGGGGKTAQSSSQISIPPEIMARYNSVNDAAEKAAQTPFQKYSDDPNAFVAPMTQSQQSAQSGIDAAQGMYQPYFNTASTSLNTGLGAANTANAQAGSMYNNALGQEQGYQNTAGSMYNNALGQEQGYQNAAGAGTNAALATGQGYNSGATSYTMAGAQAVDPTALGAAQIGAFMSPYQQSVVNSTMANLQQQQGQERSALQGNQIASGAFGGSRAGLESANLSRQQDLASGQVLSQLNNQNYSQALGAAQQQQGVGLSAAQSNRAALQQTGLSLANIGQQAYGQQMGNAQELASLGQQGYNTISNTGSNLAALGQQGFAAINQTGQNIQGLGAAQFNQGLSASQQQAALGSGAMQNELAGRQAQMGAGTVQQQTQQAGQSALYNQFLQQQGYPFQVAQFLAGIAEGTGSLSGSTTTSTQPSSFMGNLSDARMKENIEPIGETYDGQKIVKFRYRGRPEKQIGLIAQNVERAHPDAVRESGGVKYVDYDRATKGAAERGHFADGGAASDPTMAEILRIQQAMYPFAAEQGSTHTGGGSGPRGIALAPEHSYTLKTAEAPKIHQDGLHELAGAATDASSLAKAGTDIYNKFSSDDGLGAAATNEFKDVTSSLPTAAEDLMPMRRGGLARAAFARGGHPYESDDSYVPDEDDGNHQLMVAQAPGSGGGGSGLKDVADIAKVAAMFAKRGGRTGYADGGAPDDGMDDYDNFQLERGGDMYRDALGGYPTSAPDLTDRDLDPATQNAHERAHPFEKVGDALGAVHRFFGRASKSMGSTSPDMRYPGMGDSSPDAPKSRQVGATGSWGDDSAPGLGAAAVKDTVPVARRPDPQPVSEDYDIAPAHAPMQKADLQRPASLGTPAPDSPEGMAALSGSNDKSQQRPGWFKRNQDWLVPLMKGAGAMASSNSRFLAPALLQGAAGAAGAYEDVQGQMATRDTQAMGQESQKASIAGTAYNRQLNAVRTYQNGQMTWVPWNRFYQDFMKGTHYQLAPLTPQEKINGVPEAKSTPTGSPSSPPGGDAAPVSQNAGPPPSINDQLPDSEKAFAHQVAQHMMSNPDFRNTAQYAGQPQMSPFADIRNSAQASYTTDPQIKEMATSLSKLASVGNGGPVSERLNALGMIFNNAFQSLGLPMRIEDPKTLADAQSVDKYSTMIAQNAAQSGNQHAYAAIERALKAVPSMLNSPEGMRQLTASLMVQQQRAKDLDSYASLVRQNVARETGDPVANFSGEQIQPRFDATYNKQYLQDQKSLERMFDTQVTDQRTNTKVPLFQYLTENGNSLPPKYRRQLIQEFGPALRYFNIR